MRSGKRKRAVDESSEIDKKLPFFDAFLNHCDQDFKNCPEDKQLDLSSCTCDSVYRFEVKPKELLQHQQKEDEQQQQQQQPSGQQQLLLPQQNYQLQTPSQSKLSPLYDIEKQRQQTQYEEQHKQYCFQQVEKKRGEKGSRNFPPWKLSKHNVSDKSSSLQCSTLGLALSSRPTVLSPSSQEYNPNIRAFTPSATAHFSSTLAPGCSTTNTRRPSSQNLNSFSVYNSSPSLSSIASTSESPPVPSLNLNEEKKGKSNNSMKSQILSNDPNLDCFIPYKVGERILLPGGVVSLELYFTVPLVWSVEKREIYINKVRNLSSNEEKNGPTETMNYLSDNKKVDKRDKGVGTEANVDAEAKLEPEIGAENDIEIDADIETEIENETDIFIGEELKKNHKIVHDGNLKQNERKVKGSSSILEETETITIYVREYVLEQHESNLSFPHLLFLQGGPGLASPRISSINSGWMKRVLKDFRVLLLDQRGTGKSSPISMQTLPSTIFTPEDQFSILLNYRADSIILDCEAIRLAYLTNVSKSIRWTGPTTSIRKSSTSTKRLTAKKINIFPQGSNLLSPKEINSLLLERNDQGNDKIENSWQNEDSLNSTASRGNDFDQGKNNVFATEKKIGNKKNVYVYTTVKWTVLGQSYGGFILLSYLSKYPDALAACLFTGGLPPLSTQNSEEIYRRLYHRVIQRNVKYYQRYPEDIARVRKIVEYLHDRKKVPLPSGGYLTPNRFLQLGASLGNSTGCEDLHYLLEDAFFEQPLYFVESKNRNSSNGSSKLNNQSATENDYPCNEKKIHESESKEPMYITVEEERRKKNNEIRKEENFIEIKMQKEQPGKKKEASFELSYKFLRSVEAVQQIYDTNPLYSILHEQIYCHGNKSPAPHWAANRILINDEEFQYVFDYKRKLSSGHIKEAYYSKTDLFLGKTLLSSDAKPSSHDLVNLPQEFKHELKHRFFYHNNSNRGLKYSSFGSIDEITTTDGSLKRSERGSDSSHSLRPNRISRKRSISSTDTIDSCNSFCTFNCQCSCESTNCHYHQSVVFSASNKQPECDRLLTMRPSSSNDVTLGRPEENDGESYLKEQPSVDSLGNIEDKVVPVLGADLNECIFFTAEAAYPWMFDDYIGLQNFKEVATMFSNYDNSENDYLYDVNQLKHNTVPCAAVVYTGDMYVESSYSMETATCIGNMYTWVTNEYNHSALNEHGYIIVDKLLRGINKHTTAESNV